VAEQRGVDIPALVYEARPVVSDVLLCLAVTSASRDTLARHRKKPNHVAVHSDGSARGVLVPPSSGKLYMSTWAALDDVWVRHARGSSFLLHRNALCLCFREQPTPPSPAGAADRRYAGGAGADAQALQVQTERTGLPGLDVSISVQERHEPEPVHSSDAATTPAPAAPAEEQLGRTEPTDWLLPDSIKLGLGDFIFYSVLTGTGSRQALHVDCAVFMHLASWRHLQMPSIR